MTHPAPIQHLPPVTQDHLQRAVVVLAYRDTTFEQAMADPVRRQVLHTCASHLRTQDYEHTTKRTVEPIRRIKLGADGHPIGWCTQVVPGKRTSIQQPDFFNQQ